MCSFNMSNTTCDTCDTSVAVCDYNKSLTDAVPVGSILVPLDGYWHSSPWSSQVRQRGQEAGTTCPPLVVPGLDRLPTPQILTLPRPPRPSRPSLQVHECPNTHLRCG